jgi:hypothetical protein
MLLIREWQLWEFYWRQEATPLATFRCRAAERAGMPGLNEGQKVSFEVVADRRTGKSSANNLGTA